MTVFVLLLVLVACRSVTPRPGRGLALEGSPSGWDHESIVNRSRDGTLKGEPFEREQVATNSEGRYCATLGALLS